jgi:hypothetical protein
MLLSLCSRMCSLVFTGGRITPMCLCAIESLMCHVSLKFYYVKLATFVGEAHGIAQLDQLLLKLVFLPLNRINLFILLWLRASHLNKIADLRVWFIDNVVFHHPHRRKHDPAV